MTDLALDSYTLDIDDLPEAPEVDETAGAVERYDQARADIEHALSPTRQAVSMLSQLTELSARLSGTEFVPKALRGKPAAVLACILTGQELGVGPMQSLAHIHVIEGKPTQSAELMRALVQKAGHRFVVRKLSGTEVIVAGTRSDTGDELEVTWTWADAQTAKVTGKDVWKQYPRAMLLARATSELCRAHFADVLGGVSYTPDELGADVYIDPHDGRMILDGDVVGEGPDEHTTAATAAGGSMGWAEAADYVEGLRPREVVEALKAHGADCAGKAPDLKARLTEILATGDGAGITDAEVIDDDDQVDEEVVAANEAMRERLGALEADHAKALKAWWPESGLPYPSKTLLTLEQLDRLDRKVVALVKAPTPPTAQDAEDGPGSPDAHADPETAPTGSGAADPVESDDIVDAVIVDDDDPGDAQPARAMTAEEADMVCEGCARHVDELVEKGLGGLVVDDDTGLPYCADCVPF